MRPMTLSRLALLVALYLSLDVSNPMFPGALTFGLEDSVEVRQADRLRGHDDGMPLPLARGSERLALSERSGASSRAPAPPIPRFRRAHAPRAHLPLRAPAPSFEDH